MASVVYFHNLRTRGDKGNRVSKVADLFDRANFAGVVHEGDLTAIKLHFGERGNDGFISPVLVRPVVDKVKACGGRPFLTDTNTLYSGSRHNSVDHLVTALEHGFDYAVTGAPIIISDGLRSEHVREARIAKKHFSSVKLAGDIVSADSMVVMTHFKAHEMAGFGGAIKNLAMGGATAAGKRQQHALKMSVDADPCVGCGECMTVCQEKAIGLEWETEIVPFMERMTEYAYGVAKSLDGRIGYINFLTNITPDCDCCSWSDAPIVPDIGFLASTDPVALDQASHDLVNGQTGLRESMLEANLEAGGDKFRGLRGHTEPEVQLSYGEEIGLGSRRYDLVTL
jgi:uncharacterized Fe-S center protein